MQNITGHILAILSGNKVTTWEYAHDDPDRQLQEPITRYPYGELPLSSICWNHNRMCLATCSSISTEEQEHDNIQLISSQSGNRLDSFQHNKDEKHKDNVLFDGAVANTLQFGGKSRYLCIGDESGSVVLWDLKKKMRVRHFWHPEHPSRQVSLDPTDTYVLSLSPDALFVYNLREGKLIQTLVPPDTSSDDSESSTVFAKFCTSALEPSTVAVGTNDGSVFLYDIRSSNNSEDDDDDEAALPSYALMRRHSGAVTGMAFSPIHANVLVTSGSDGTIKMFNIRTGETIKDFRPEVESPINALHLHAAASGSLCSIGCDSGDVFVLDLQLDGESQVVAHLNVGGPVEQVAFIPPPRAKDLSAPLSTPAKSVNSLPMAPTPAKFRLEQHNVPYIATRSLASSSAAPSIGSPNSTTVLKAQENIPSTTTTAPSPVSSGPFPLPARKSSLSPRRTFIVQAMRQQQKTEQKPKTPSPGNSPVRKGITSSGPPNNSNNDDVNAQPLAIKSRAPRSTFMKARSGALGRHLYAGSSSPQQENIPEEQGEKLNADEIRDVVREEVENLQDEMEEQLRNLHMDMIAQFHQQSQEMNNAIAKHLTTIERLTEENQRLREENDLLRHGS